MLKRTLLTALLAGAILCAPALAHASAPTSLPGSATLKEGATGAQVRILQEDLTLLSDPCAVDGVFGAGTLAAVREFQQYTGIGVDGVVGSVTWGEIHALLNQEFHPTSGTLAATGAQYGDVGQPVVELQQDLSSAGFSPGPIDGVYSAATSSAVLAFEKAHGLSPTTVVGAAVVKALGGGSATSGSSGSSGSGSSTSSGSSSSGSTGSTIDGRPVLRTIALTATAYGPSAQDNYPYGAVDYFGNPLVAGDVAVDPTVIPLDTWLWVQGYSFKPYLPAAGFLAHAVDEGDAIKGKRIDIFVNEPDSIVSNFGIQTVEVSVLGS